MAVFFVFAGFFTGLVQIRTMVGKDFQKK